LEYEEISNNNNLNNFNNNNLNNLNDEKYEEKLNLLMNKYINKNADNLFLNKSNIQNSNIIIIINIIINS
jgi:hypothetical protein